MYEVIFEKQVKAKGCQRCGSNECHLTGFSYLTPYGPYEYQCAKCHHKGLVKYVKPPRLNLTSEQWVMFSMVVRTRSIDWRDYLENLQKRGQIIEFGEIEYVDRF